MDAKLQKRLPKPPHGMAWHVTGKGGVIYLQLMLDQGNEGWWGTSYHTTITDIGHNPDTWRDLVVNAAMGLMEQREARIKRENRPEPKILDGIYT